MGVWQWLLLAVIAAAVLWGVTILALAQAGRGGDARALARFIPDCVVLLRRLLADSRVPRSRKILLGMTVAYLVMPLDLVPDFLPVVGQLDDAILLVVVLRSVVRSGGPQLLTELWPGPEESLRVVLRVSDRPGGAA